MSSALTPYAGDPHKVLLDAIDAKVNNQLTDAQFEMVVSSVQAIPVQRVHEVEAHLISEAQHYSRTQVVHAWLSARPVIGTLLVGLALALAGITAWALAAATQAFWTWLSLHVVSVGVTVFIVMVMVLIFKTLTVQSRRANADMWMARRPTVIHDYGRSDEVREAV